MKVCKKCKTKVANKAKICKKCGADVSKAKVIQTTNNKNKSKNIQKQKPIAINNSKKKQQLVVTKSKTPKNQRITNDKHISKKTNNEISRAHKNIIKYIIYILKKVSKSILTHIKTQRIKSKDKRQVKTIEIKDEQNKTKKLTTKKHTKVKLALVLAFISILSGVIYCAQKYIYEDLAENSIQVVKGEKATTDKIFSMNDVITYNDVDYKIVKIETSKGNNYKTPKEGHQFLIVTVYIKNNSDKKVEYSYENWTMSNSKEEEKKRIFTSINVDTALYSGELVVGGIKIGSMVFEQPINDKKLKLNYYELKKDKDGNEVIDEAKRIFSISIKNSENEIKQSKALVEENSKIIKKS